MTSYNATSAIEFLKQRNAERRPADDTHARGNAASALTFAVVKAMESVGYSARDEDGGTTLIHPTYAGSSDADSPRWVWIGARAGDHGQLTALSYASPTTAIPLPVSYNVNHKAFEGTEPDLTCYPDPGKPIKKTDPVLAIVKRLDELYGQR